MATITSTLSKVNKTSNLAEILFFFCGGRTLRCRVKSGLFVNPQNWSEKTGAPKQTKIDKKHAELCKKFNDLTTLILEEFQVADSKTLSKEWLLQLIDKFHHPENFIERPKTLLGVFADFIDTISTRQTSDGKRMTTGSQWQYKLAFAHLQDYATYQKRLDFELCELDGTFYRKYVAYLQKREYTTNTIGKDIKVIKAVINSLDSELRSQCDMSKFHVTKEEVDSTYLNEDELQQLKECDLSKQPHLERIRDWFLLLAWTGSRFSDLEKITKADAENGFVTFRQQKTGNKVTIPLHPVVVDILNKYECQMPKIICNQKFNNYLKEVCKLAGLDKLESTTRTSGGVTKTEQRPQYELVTSHTGRRSFATNMYKRGLPTITIMAITGHTTEKSFLRYIKVKQEEHAQIMATAWKEMYNK